VAPSGKSPGFAPLHPGPPLGTVPGIRRESTSVVLEHGDVIAFYTDGLVERRGEPLDVGLGQLRDIFTNADPHSVARDVMIALVGDRAPHDDIALVVARRTSAVPAAVPPADDDELDAVGVGPQALDHVEAEFPNQNTTPAAVRSLVRSAMAAWQLEDLVANAVLLADELAGNAVRHARTPLTLRASRTAGSVRAAVDDRCRAPPAPIPPGAEGAGGRGILLVDALSSRWGFEIHEDGKTVWFELDTAD